MSVYGRILLLPTPGMVSYYQVFKQLEKIFWVVFGIAAR
jgi:hypothetical protein